MNILIWFENNMRYNSTIYVNPSAIYGLVVTDDMEVESRLSYDFNPVDFMNPNSSNVTYCIYKNWLNFFDSLDKHIGHNDKVTFVFAFSSDIRDFTNMNKKVPNSVRYDNLICLSHAGLISNNTFKNCSSGAECLWELYNIYKKVDKKHLVMALNSHNEQMKKKIDSRVNRTNAESGKKAVNKTYGLLESQAIGICSKLGYYTKINNGSMCIQTICGEYLLDLAERPISLSKITGLGKYEVMNAKIYSPLDAIIHIYKYESNIIRQTLEKINTLSL